MSYNPPVSLYYSKHDSPLSVTDADRLVPAPQISITPEYYYANDTIVGYTYNITLNGYATSVDLRSESLNVSSLGFNEVLQSIQTINNIFNSNGGTLIAYNNNNDLVFRANGGIVRSLSFQESDNLWVNYSQYSVNLEFNELQLADCSGSGNIVACDMIPEAVVETPELVEMKKYRVKSFNDGWSFELGDTIYNSYTVSSNSGNFRNDHFIVNYNISSIGKHYIDYNNDDTNLTLIPAWEQAKNFVQYRLTQQVNRLISNVLSRNESNDSCTPYSALSGLFDNGLNGLLDNLSDSDYKVYNEKVSCTASEAEGSFSASYSAIIKRYKTGDVLSHPNSIHTFNLTRNVEDDGVNKVITISVDGNIQGLIEGGLIRSSGVLSLPNSGQFFLVVGNPSGSKYNNALTAYNKIGDSNKLNDDFAKSLDITYAALGISPSQTYGNCKSPEDIPSNTSHSLTHNYTEGVIAYKTSYDSNRACNDNLAYKNISITVDDPVPTIAEFIVPGRSGGPIIQIIGTNKPKRISISIDGAQQISGQSCCTDFEQVVLNNCEADLSVFEAAAEGLTLVENKFTVSNDGSYTINRAYICCD